MAGRYDVDQTTAAAGRHSVVQCMHRSRLSCSWRSYAHVTMTRWGGTPGYQGQRWRRRLLQAWHQRASQSQTLDRPPRRPCS